MKKYLVGSLFLACVAQGADVSPGKGGGGTSSVGGTNVVIYTSDGTAISASNPLPISGNVGFTNSTIDSISVTNFDNIRLTTTWTGPNDTTAYPANTILSTGLNTDALPLTITGIVNTVGGSFTINKIQLTTSNVFLALVRLWFYSTTNLAYSNRALHKIVYGNSANRIGYVDLPTLFTNTTAEVASYCMTNSVDFDGNCAATDTNVYVWPEIRSAATPIAYQEFTLTITAKHK